MTSIAYNAMVLRPPYTGVEHAVVRVGQGLLDRAEPGGFSVTVFCPRTERPPPFRVRHACDRVVRCGAPFRSRLLRILWEQFVLPLRLRRFDLLHAPAYVSPLFAPCPVALTVYDLHALDAPARCRFLNRWNFRLQLPRSLRGAAAVLVPTEHTRAAVLRRFPSLAERIRVVPLPISDSFREPPRKTAPDGSPPYLLCVGNLEPRKNLPLAVAALRRLRDTVAPSLQLRIAGHASMGDGALKRLLRDDPSLRAAVRFTGYVADDALPGLYAGAEAFVYPSVDEGFGLPPLEAMACGCPVLCANTDTAREVCGDAAIFVDPSDPSDLADAVAALLASPERRARLVERGRSRAALFRTPEITAQHLGIYRAMN